MNKIKNKTEKCEKNKTIIIVISFILVICWMILVFLFSSQISDESSKTSGCLIETIIKLITGNNANKVLIESLQHIVRKLAHFSIYAIGGILILSHINVSYENLKYKKTIALIIGIIYAITDEIHQLFIPGRSGNIKDICIDSLGVATGILLIYLVRFYIMKIRKK
ncbi:MAG: VanZ family protein [Clostridia bacterium]